MALCSPLVEETSDMSDQMQSEEVVSLLQAHDEQTGNQEDNCLSEPRDQSSPSMVSLGEEQLPDEEGEIFVQAAHTLVSWFGERSKKKVCTHQRWKHGPLMCAIQVSLLGLNE